jgi:hypothetical protein
MGKSRGWQLFIVGVFGSELSTIVEKFPTHEIQVRPLVRLGNWKDPKPELWNEAWGKACVIWRGITSRPRKMWRVLWTRCCGKRCHRYFIFVQFLIDFPATFSTILGLTRVDG